MSTYVSFLLTKMANWFLSHPGRSVIVFLALFSAGFSLLHLLWQAAEEMGPVWITAASENITCTVLILVGLLIAARLEKDTQILRRCWRALPPFPDRKVFEWEYENSESEESSEIFEGDEWEYNSNALDLTLSESDLEITF